MQTDHEKKAAEEFGRLIALMARLRSPDGCPWDREQTFQSIKAFTLEETYEVLDAIDSGDWVGLSEELGDFTLQAVFYARMAEEAGYFCMADVLQSINGKLVRRHPHIFGDRQAATADDVRKTWDEVKKKEKPHGDRLLLDTISRSAPALLEASQISAKAARSGFDWPNIESVFTKLNEELHELSAARDAGQQEKVEEELGDVLFTLVNIARFLRVDPEQALRKSNRKFRLRFGFVERSLRAKGGSLEAASVDEMEQLWQEAKSAE